ncbi:MAG: SPOR domain-containing protein [Fibromonadales bacterium]|nr:SPOR domain-containing protein [Fibromonadales bacterium]
MEKKIVLLTVVAAFSVFFFACKEDDSIAIPMPPPLPTGQADDTLLKDDSKKPAKGKEKAAPAAKKEVAKKETKPAAKPASVPCTAPCDTDSEQLSAGRYTIQIGVFPSESSARSLVRRMSENGIRAYYAQVDNPAQLLGSYYRVRVGFFNGRTDAEDFAKSKLQPIGYAWWVDKRKNDKVGGTGGSFGGSNNYDNYTFTPSKSDNELEATRQAYREQTTSLQQQGASSGTSSKRKKVTRNKSSDDDFDWDD